MKTSRVRARARRARSGVSARRPLSIAKPRAVGLHALTLIVGRTTLAGRHLVASRRRAPAVFGAVVRIVRRLEGGRARDDFGERELLHGSVGPFVRKPELVAGKQALSRLLEAHP